MAVSDKRGKKRPLNTGDVQEVTIVAVNDTPEVFENTNFVVGQSPVTLDFNVALGRNATRFSLINDGAGTFTVEISNDGNTFGDAYTLKAGETYPEEMSVNIDVDSIKLTHVSDASFRCLAM